MSRARLVKIEEDGGVIIGGLLPPGHLGDYGIKASTAAWEVLVALLDEVGELHKRMRRVDAVVEAAAVRAQVLRDLREYGSGSEGWSQRDTDSDAELLAAVEAWQRGIAEEGK